MLRKMHNFYNKKSDIKFLTTNSEDNTKNLIQIFLYITLFNTLLF